MTKIVLTEEQIRQLSDATESVVVVDADGRPVAYVASGFNAEEVEAAEQRARSDGPWHSTEAVLAHLHSISAEADARTR